MRVNKHRPRKGVTRCCLHLPQALIKYYNDPAFLAKLNAKVCARLQRAMSRRHGGVQLHFQFRPGGPLRACLCRLVGSSVPMVASHLTAHPATHPAVRLTRRWGMWRLRPGLPQGHGRPRPRLPPPVKRRSQT